MAANTKIIPGIKLIVNFVISNAVANTSTNTGFKKLYAATLVAPILIVLNCSRKKLINVVNKAK